VYFISIITSAPPHIIRHWIPEVGDPCNLTGFQIQLKPNKCFYFPFMNARMLKTVPLRLSSPTSLHKKSGNRDSEKLNYFLKAL